MLALVLHAWIDGYFAWNDNRRLNFYDDVGTAAHRANEPALNVAAFEIVRDPKPLGFHVVVGAGDALDVVHAAEPHRIRNLYQASATYSSGKASLEAGVYPSHIGFEGFFTKDNWNYTRGWLGEMSPYYQAGVKGAYAFSSRWSAQVHVLRGWQNISASVPAAIGTQVAYSGKRLSASFNTYADPHRKFGDLAATWTTTPKLTLGISVDRGHQSPANWLGIGTWARYQLDPRNAVAARIESFRDPRGGISGFAQTLDEQTLTYELRPQQHLIVKLEGRRDHSTAPVFSNGHHQTLGIASALITY